MQSFENYSWSNDQSLLGSAQTLKIRMRVNHFSSFYEALLIYNSPNEIAILVIAAPDPWKVYNLKVTFFVVNVRPSGSKME